MTYDARERSVHDGSPVELYEFVQGATVWRYTSQAVDYDLGGEVYIATPIKRTAIEATQAVERSDIRVTVLRDNAAAARFIAVPPSNVMTLTVRRVHRGDAEVAVVWFGRVLNASWRDSECELMAEPVVTSLRRVGLRRVYGRNCPHALYDLNCRADPALLRLTGTMTAINGTVITVPGASTKAPNALNGGFASWTASGGGSEQRMILSHTGDNVELIAEPFGLEVGALVNLHDGCLHTLGDCDARFSNSPNYGGFPWVPLKNPFGGTPVY